MRVVTLILHLGQLERSWLIRRNLFLHISSIVREFIYGDGRFRPRYGNGAHFTGLSRTASLSTPSRVRPICSSMNSARGFALCYKGLTQ